MRSFSAKSALILQKVMEYYRKLGDRAFQERGGRAEEPDLRAIARDGRRIIWQMERDASHPDQVLKNFENFRDQCDLLCFGVPDDSVGQRIIKILGSKGYELGRDYFIYIIPVEEEKGVENVY